MLILGENFAVFRSLDGDVNILNAYCPHLGANMAIGGIVVGNSLRCPFHGWTFDGTNGKCVQVPSDCSNGKHYRFVYRYVYRYICL